MHPGEGEGDADGDGVGVDVGDALGDGDGVAHTPPASSETLSTLKLATPVVGPVYVNRIV